MKKVSKRIRLAALQADLNSLEKEIDDRVANPAMQGIPGGNEGLLKVTTITVGAGEKARTIQNASFDAELVAKVLLTLDEARELTKRPKIGPRKTS